MSETRYPYKNLNTVADSIEHVTRLPLKDGRRIAEVIFAHYDVDAGVDVEVHVKWQSAYAFWRLRRYPGRPERTPRPSPGMPRPRAKSTCSGV